MRLLTTARLDMRLQARNKLYVIGLSVALATGFAARAFLDVAAIETLLPGLWLGAVGSTTFMFVAGMVLFEKGEGTLDALIVTPLEVGTYLGSKVATLAGFALVESVVVLVVAQGLTEVALLPLLLGLVFLGVLYTLVAVAQVAAHESVTDFLVPGGIVTLTLLQIPFLDAFGIWSHPVLMVVPTQATVVLMKGGFSELSTGEWLYGVGYSLVAVVGAAYLARARFERYVVRKAAP